MTASLTLKRQQCSDNEMQILHLSSFFRSSDEDFSVKVVSFFFVSSEPLKREVAA